MNTLSSYLNSLDDGVDKKLGLSLRACCILGILAGFYISIGGYLYLRAGGLLGSALFPIGLILISILGGRLFTGEVATLLSPTMNRRLTYTEYWLSLSVIWILNFIGAILFTALIIGAGLDENIRDALVIMVDKKIDLKPLECVFRGIGANIMVCLAVYLAGVSKSFIGKCFALWLPVFAFVAIGFEHSIANMFFLSLSLTSETLSGSIMNLLFSTIGNIIGGCLVAISYHFANKG